MHGQYVWYDLITSDPVAAQRYYPPLTGWKTQKFDDPSSSTPYTMWTMDGMPLGGVGPIAPDQAAMGVKPYWLPAVHVNNIDQSTQKVTSLGGKVVHGPTAIPGMGRYAVIQDPQGAMISLYQSDGPTSGFDGTPSIGRFSWNELMTTDYRKAFDFYRQLFGWEKTGEMDMGGGSMYLMYGQKGKPFGGIFDRTASGMPNMPPNWLPYVTVKDIKRTVDAATKAGGILGRGPMDVPGGIIAILADPQGARYALYEVTGPADATSRAKPQKARKAKAAKPRAVKSSAKKTKRAKQSKKATKAKPKSKARPKARAGKKAAKKKRR